MELRSGLLAALLVATTVLSAGSGPAARETLSGLADGSRTAVLVVPGPTSATDEFPAHVQATGEAQDGGDLGAAAAGFAQRDGGQLGLHLLCQCHRWNRPPVQRAIVFHDP